MKYFEKTANSDEGTVTVEISVDKIPAGFILDEQQVDYIMRDAVEEILEEALYEARGDYDH